jgi:hypothetical protein
MVAGVEGCADRCEALRVSVEGGRGVVWDGDDKTRSGYKGGGQLCSWTGSACDQRLEVCCAWRVRVVWGAVFPTKENPSASFVLHHTISASPRTVTRPTWLAFLGNPSAKATTLHASPKRARHRLYSR